MCKHLPRPHLDALRRLREALEVPPCKCRRRRLHTRECNKSHVHPDPKLKRKPCPDPRNGEIGICACQRDCDCRFDLTEPPCEHVRAANHSMSLGCWQKFLEANDPEGEYVEPELPTAPIIHGDREARVDALSRRESQGIGLFYRELDRVEDDDLAQQTQTESGGTGRSLKEMRKA